MMGMTSVGFDRKGHQMGATSTADMIGGRAKDLRAQIDDLRAEEAGARARADQLSASFKDQGIDVLASAHKASFAKLDALYGDADQLKGRLDDTRDSLNALLSEHGTEIHSAAPGTAGSPSRNEFGTEGPMFLHLAAQNEATPSGGGYTVPEPLLNELIGALRPMSVFLGAGARIFPMHSETLRIPKMGTGVAGAWVNENSPIPDEDMVLDQVTLTARKVGVITSTTHELLHDSGLEVVRVIEEEHVKALGLKLDLAFFKGSGTAPEPRGLLNMVGISAIDKASGASDLDDVEDALATLEASNADMSKVELFMHPTLWHDYRKVKETTGGYLMGGVTEPGKRELFGHRVHTSTQLIEADSEFFIAAVDMSQIAVGFRQPWDVDIDPNYDFASQLIGIRTTSRWDIQPLNAAGVCLVTNISS